MDTGELLFFGVFFVDGGGRRCALDPAKNKCRALLLSLSSLRPKHTHSQLSNPHNNQTKQPLNENKSTASPSRACTRATLAATWPSSAWRGTARTRTSTSTGWATCRSRCLDWLMSWGWGVHPICTTFCARATGGEGRRCRADGEAAAAAAAAHTHSKKTNPVCSSRAPSIRYVNQHDLPRRVSGKGRRRRTRAPFSIVVLPPPLRRLCGRRVRARQARDDPS